MKQCLATSSFLFMLTMSLFLSCITVCLPACAESITAQDTIVDSLIQSKSTSSSLAPATTSAAPTAKSQMKALVIYFSQPEHNEHDLELEDDTADILTGASLIFNHHRAQLQGNIEYMAQTIADSINSPLVRIEAKIRYPLTHDALITRSVNEFDSKSRPQIQLHPDVNLDDYDTIFLGYPVWWNDLPMPVYSFLDTYDLANKRVLLFCSFDKSNPFNTFKIISQLEPKALFFKNLSIERAKLLQRGEKRIHSWLEDLKFEKFSDTAFHINTNANPIILLNE